MRIENLTVAAALAAAADIVALAHRAARQDRKQGARVILGGQAVTVLCGELA